MAQNEIASGIESSPANSDDVLIETSSTESKIEASRFEETNAEILDGELYEEYNSSDCSSIFASIRSVLNRVYIVTLDQLKLLFNTNIEASLIETYVTALVQGNYLHMKKNIIMLPEIAYVDSKNQMRVRKASNISVDSLKGVLKCFWVIAAQKIENLRDFRFDTNLKNLTFITKSGEIYDVTYIKQVADADSFNRLLLWTLDKMRDLSQAINEEESVDVNEDDNENDNGKTENLLDYDTVIHIALIDDEDIVPDLSEYPFDFYCMLDDDNWPTLYNFPDDEEG